MTLLEKLQSLIFVREDGCWMFLGPWNSHGYGHLSYDAHVYRAHRVSWELHKGPIPDNLNVLHKCDVRHCRDHRDQGTRQRKLFAYRS